MLNLTSNIQVPNITKMQVTQVHDDEQNSILRFLVIVQGNSHRVYNTYHCEITNGNCIGARAKANPNALTDVVENFDLELPTGYTDCQAQMTANSGTGRAKNIESYMQSVGLLPAGTVN